MRCTLSTVLYLVVLVTGGCHAESVISLGPQNGENAHGRRTAGGSILRAVEQSEAMLLRKLMQVATHPSCRESLVFNSSKFFGPRSETAQVEELSVAIIISYVNDIHLRWISFMAQAMRKSSTQTLLLGHTAVLARAALDMLRF